MRRGVDDSGIESIAVASDPYEVEKFGGLY